MKNKEKWAEKIEAVGGIGKVAVVDGKPVSCERMRDCHKCDLFDRTMYCDSLLQAWLEQESDKAFEEMVEEKAQELMTFSKAERHKFILGDKLNRIKSLTNGSVQQVNEESLRDTLIDLANYSIMAILELEGN